MTYLNKVTDEYLIELFNQLDEVITKLKVYSVKDVILYNQVCSELDKRKLL